MERLGTAI
ncbi:hypothetical protein GQ600_16045 [Phytophthora cactorum]|nr:hypothetical protein GQ600_16045 [Phytophthora cactorum]